MRYFIFDTGVTLSKPDYTQHDKEFEQYFWSKGRFNKVREGDKFIYRKPSKVSANKQFYFFGIGTVGEIIKIGEDKFGKDNVICKVIEPVRFENLVFQKDDALLNYDWKWKKRIKENGWGQFFNNYGMNKIPQEDFDFLCSLGLDSTNSEYAEVDNLELVKSHLNFSYQNQEAEDRYSKTKTRGSEQKIFSDNVKIIYNNQCCISGIKTRSLLQGCHISPWAKDKKNRQNLNNSLCLSLILHKCYDEGIITIDQDYKVLLSTKIDDKELIRYLSNYNRKKINLPIKREFYPDKKFLLNHTNTVYKG